MGPPGPEKRSLGFSQGLAGGWPFQTRMEFVLLDGGKIN
jgi:hypothetical protein